MDCRIGPDFEGNAGIHTELGGHGHELNGHRFLEKRGVDMDMNFRKS